LVVDSKSIWPVKNLSPAVPKDLSLEDLWRAGPDPEWSAEKIT